MTELPVVPAVRAFVPEVGALRLADLRWVRTDTEDPALERTMALGARLLGRAAGLSLPGAQPDADGPGLLVTSGATSGVPDAPTLGRRADDGDPQAEHHTIAITADGIAIAARAPEGVHRALTTLAQLAAIGGGVLPLGRIADGPRYAWRGLSLDVVRWFVPLEELRRVVDLASLAKLNVLHLHLTDDQGWRVPVEGRPELTDGKPHYSREEFADLVEYARERFVSVVCEVDLPGHAGAVLDLHPELRDPGTTVPEGFPARTGNLDPDSAAAWRFVDDVVTELARMSTAAYVHLGGDEPWGMADAAHAAFVTRLAALVAERGKKVVGWQEAARGALPEDALVQHWIDFVSDEPPSDDDPAEADTDASPRLPLAVRRFFHETFQKAAGDLQRAADQGLGVILSPTAHAYCDRPHGDRSLDPDQERLRSRLGLADAYPPTTLQAFADWDPDATPAGLPAEQVAGVEAAVWGETITSEEDLELLLLPRLPVVADAAWRSGPAEWASIRNRLAAQPPVWRLLDLRWFRADSVPWAPDEATAQQ